VATTVKEAVLPWHTDCGTGWVVIPGVKRLFDLPGIANNIKNNKQVIHLWMAPQQSARK